VLDHAHARLAGHSACCYLRHSYVSVRKRARAWINATKFNELSERLLLCLKWSASFMTKHPGVQLKQFFYLPFTEVIHLVACEPFIA